MPATPECQKIESNEEIAFSSYDAKKRHTSPASVPDNAPDIETLKKYFNGKTYFNGNVTYSKYKFNFKDAILKNLLMQKAIHDKDFLKAYMHEICVLLPTEKLKYINEELGLEHKLVHIKKENASFDIESLKNTFKEILTTKNKKHSEIKFPLFKQLFDTNEKDEIIYDMNIGMAGVLTAHGYLL